MIEILEWIPIPVEEESLIIPRLSHTCTPVGSYLFVIGGHDGVHFSNQVLLFNLVSLSWELRTPSGLPPSFVSFLPSFFEHELIQDRVDQEVIIKRFYTIQDCSS